MQEHSRAARERCSNAPEMANLSGRFSRRKHPTFGRTSVDPGGRRPSDESTHAHPLEVLMAPAGPMLPRKATSLKHCKDQLSSVAHSIGLVIAIERNRLQKTQDQLADGIALGQEDISDIENGKSVQASEARIKELFEAVGLETEGQEARFIIWWQRNSK
jgi:ribosome-binding protein aMBF1 (putative translation factor)